MNVEGYCDNIIKRKIIGIILKLNYYFYYMVLFIIIKPVHHWNQIVICHIKNNINNYKTLIIHFLNLILLKI